MNKSVKYILLLVVLSFSYLQSKSQKQIYAVIVGVSNYENDYLNLDLNYCDDDARSFYNLLIYSGVEEKNIALLVDYKAKKQNIIKKLDQVFSLADSDDEVIFFFSGHGGKGSFIPYNYNGSDSTILEHKEIKASFKSCKANKKLCFADACFSGSIKRPQKKSISEDKSVNFDEKNAGIAVMMSSRDNQTSREMPSLKSGAFTYYLVKGLKGSADTNRDKIITISEIYYYTKDEVKKETYNAQVPVIFGDFDEKMPILFLK